MERKKGRRRRKKSKREEGTRYTATETQHEPIENNHPLSPLFSDAYLFPFTVSFLPPHTICSVITLVCRGWNECANNERLWEVLSFLHSEGDAARSIEHHRESVYSSWKDFYRIHNSISWDTTQLPEEIKYQNEILTPCSKRCIKLSYLPDISFALGKQSFSCGTVGWIIKIHAMNCEMRVGFTNDRQQLMTSRYVYTLNNPALYCYSDGRQRRGVYMPRQQHDPNPRQFKTGDEVGVLLDFDAKTVSFYHNGELQYRKATLPAGSLTPVVAMDAGADEIEILPWRDDFVLNNNT